jgi:hypothetical protein
MSPDCTTNTGSAVVLYCEACCPHYTLSPVERRLRREERDQVWWDSYMYGQHLDEIARAKQEKFNDDPLDFWKEEA